MFRLKKSVYIGWSVAEVSKIKDCLIQNGIWYKEKIINHLGEWSAGGTVRGRVGAAGINNEYSVQYEIFVKSQDEEIARHLIRNERLKWKRDI